MVGDVCRIQVAVSPLLLLIVLQHSSERTHLANLLVDEGHRSCQVQQEELGHYPWYWYQYWADSLQMYIIVIIINIQCAVLLVSPLLYNSITVFGTGVVQGYNHGNMVTQICIAGSIPASDIAIHVVRIPGGNSPEGSLIMSLRVTQSGDVFISLVSSFDNRFVHLLCNFNYLLSFQELWIYVCCTLNLNKVNEAPIFD